LSYSEHYSDKDSYDAMKNRVVSLNGLGNIYLTLENYEMADSIFRKALAGEQHLHSALGQAINYANIGAIFESKGARDSAWIYYQHSMEMNHQAKSDLGISLCYTHFGQLYEKEKKWDEALAEYHAAYDLMRKNSDSWHGLESCIALARVNVMKGDLANAQAYLDKAEDISLKIHSLEHLADVYHLRYLCSRKKGNCKQALDYYLKSQACNDSIINEENKNHLQNLRVNYLREQNQQQLNSVRQDYLIEKHTKNLFMISAIVVLLLAIVIVCLLSYALKIRLRSQRLSRNIEETRNSFFTNITHEFRTPLTIILGLAEQLIKGEKTFPDEQLGKMIHRQGSNLLDLVNQLLDISKVRSAIASPDWHKGDVVAYLRMMIETYQVYAEQKLIQLVFKSADVHIEMDFVPEYLGKIVRNLLSNSLKFTPRGGKIIVTICASNNEFSLTIADNGVGIDSTDIPHIFDAFYQGKGSSETIGTGVGLSLVKQMADILEGNVKVESALGKGTIFTVTLPIHHREDILKQWEPKDETVKPLTKDEDDTSLAVECSESTDDNAIHILVIEDNSDVALYIGSLLEKDYELCFARNGQEGFDKANELMPDLILTDLMMPGMDGYELCRKIRSSETLNHIPIIIITAKTEDKDRVLGLEVGADAYLQKPFNADELRIRVSRLLEQRRLLREKYTRAMFENNREQIKLSVNDQNFINHLTDIIYAYMVNFDFNSEKLADKMCMSISQLNRKTKAITGVSTNVYVMQMRMEKAKKLLMNTDSPISDIAFKCGFSDSGYFSRSFKEMYKQTPSQFRKKPN
jgi:two-component system sensor histidine kinase ChiS